MSINLKQISSICVNSTTNINLKTLANSFVTAGTYTNNISLYQFCKLNGQNNLGLSSNRQNLSPYDGTMQIIRVKIVYSDHFNTGLLFQNLFNYNGNNVNNFIDSVTYSTNGISILSVTPVGTYTDVIMNGVSQGVQIGATVSFTVTFNLKQSFYKIANMSSTQLSFTQYLKYQQQPIT